MDPFTQLRHDVISRHIYLQSADPAPDAPPAASVVLTMTETQREKHWLSKRMRVFCAMLIVLVAVMMVVWLS